MGSSPGDNYFTNLIYFLPRIFFNDQKKIRLAIHRNTSNKFRIFIKKIGLKLNIKIQFIFLDDGFYFFKNSQIPQFLKVNESVKILNYFIKSILYSEPIRDKNKKAKIYVSRQNSYYRNIINEDDVIKLLKKNNFTIVDPNHLTIKKIIKIFFNTEILISPSCSNLANLIFCNSNTKIIEIAPNYSKKYEQNLKVQYKNLCNIIGINHSKIIADTIKVRKHDLLAKKYINKKILNESSHYTNLILKIKDLENYLNQQFAK